MNRWLYWYDFFDGNDPESFLEQINAMGTLPLSLRELLRSGQDNAFGGMLLDVPEEDLNALCRCTVRAGLSLCLFCSVPYSERTLYTLRKFKNLSVYPTASLLQSLSEKQPDVPLNAQVVYLDLPFQKRTLELFRECKTRVVVTKEEKLLSAISEKGFYTLLAVTSNAVRREPSSFEIPIQKDPLFKTFPIAPRVSMLDDDTLLFCAAYERYYDPSACIYKIVGAFPHVSETRVSVPQDLMAYCREKLSENTAVLLQYGKGDGLFVYGLHGDTGCLLAMDHRWKSLLLSRKGLEQVAGNGVEITLLSRFFSDAKPREDLFTGLLREYDDTKPPYRGRTAAVRFMNAFATDGSSVTQFSLQTFVEERFLIGEALAWFAAEKELYVENLENHLTFLEKELRPILRQMSEGISEMTPKRHLQWSQRINRAFASEENCVQACVEDLRRMATYRQWAKELRKKS